MTDEGIEPVVNPDYTDDGDREDDEGASLPQLGNGLKNMESWLAQLDGLRKAMVKMNFIGRPNPTVNN